MSNAVRDKLSESGVPANRMIVAKAGTPSLSATANRDVTRGELGLRPDAFAAGSFSRLAKEKGIDVFLRAMPWATDVQAMVYGEGPEGEELAHLSSFLKVSRQVTFIGRVQEVGDHMAAMDVVVIPSIWEEAFPYSALEAMSVGVPVVASRVGGIPEIVSPEVNGLLFAKGNPEDLARALQDIRSDPERCIQMGRNGQELQRQEYTVEKMAERIESAYEAFLSLP